jgi:hypothetical protein
MNNGLGKILTKDKLRKWHIIMVDWCYMSKTIGETTNHLLLHCDIVRELWTMVLILFGV